MVLTITVEFADFCALRRIERLSSEQRHQRNCKESSCVFDLHREKAAPDACFEQMAFPGPTGSILRSTPNAVKNVNLGICDLRLCRHKNL